MDEGKKVKYDVILFQLKMYFKTYLKELKTSGCYKSPSVVNHGLNSSFAPQQWRRRNKGLLSRLNEIDTIVISL